MRLVTITREELHQRVWSAPLRTVAAEIGISDVGLSKACKRHNIPTPRQGHWLRKERDRQVVALPPGNGAGPITFYVDDSEIKPAPQRSPRLAADVIEIAPNLDDAHPLVRATLESSRGATFDEVKGKQGFRHKKHLDIRVSPEQLDRALRIANALIVATEARDARWTIDDSGLTWLTFDGQRMQVHFAEKMQRVPWPKPVAPPSKKGEKPKPNWQAALQPNWKLVGTGLIHFEVDTHLASGIQHKWGSEKHPLDAQLGAIIAQLPALAVSIKAWREQIEARKQAYERKRQERILVARNLEKNRILRERLVQAAQAHQNAAAIRRYCAEVALRFEASALSTEDQARLDEWLAWARDQAEIIDPVNLDVVSLTNREVELPLGFDSTVKHPLWGD